jgi:hypothetical protein
MATAQPIPTAFLPTRWWWPHVLPLRCNGLQQGEAHHGVVITVSWMLTAAKVA